MLMTTASDITPGIIRKLTLALCVYLAAPLIDVPLLGLSLSAILIFILMFEVMNRYGGLRLRQLGILPLLLLLIWSGQLVSLAVNEIFDLETVELGVGFTYLLRYAFWFMVACLSARLLICGNLHHSVVKAFGAGVLVIAATVLLEYVLLGKPRLMTQNSYGWQFSAFAPYALCMALVDTGRFRLLWRGGFILLLLALAVNASRSSWVTMVLGIILTVGLWWLSTPKGKRLGTTRLVVALALLLSLFAGVFIFAPSTLKEKMYQRMAQSENLDRDKSWQIRLLMVQKGKQLFEESPVFGVGPGQFRISNVTLDIPLVLSYAGQENFNQRSSHNSYLQLLAEGGIALAIPYGMLLLWLLIAGFRAVFAMARNGEFWAIPVYVSFICFSAHYWSLSGITSTAPWFLYGLLAAVILRHRLKASVMIPKAG